ncbi:hypothetical protein ACP4OV_011877 [Aristida adscensionis]
MEAFVTALLGDLASRSLSFLIDRCFKKENPTKEESMDNLHRLLLRVRVIVEVAGERHITNQAMLQQLNMLNLELYRGCYTLDTLRCQGLLPCDDDDHHHHHHTAKDDGRQVSRSFTLSRFNPAKRVLFSDTGARGSSNSSEGTNKLKKALQSLETAIADVSECIVFLRTCPRMCRQPYNMHLILDKCMFGRQMELQHIISFLLQTGSHCGDDEELGVLPIIGPRRVGKSTLVEHACNDERVRDHFSQIVFFARNDIAVDESVVSLRDRGVIKHRNYDLEGQRMLVIVELDGDRFSENPDENTIEELWQRLYSTCKNCIPPDSKFIVTSQSNKIASFGTMHPLRLQFFSQEAYWYFFKVLTFGAMDTVEHKKLMSIAMDMAAMLNGCFIGANIISGMLRSNINAQFWSMALATMREFTQRNHDVSSANHPDPWEVNGAIRTPKVSERIVILDDYQMVGSASACGGTEVETPKITAIDVMFGRARPRGQFHVLSWRSQLPPHYSYVLKCELQPRHVVARKKRTANFGSR